MAWDRVNWNENYILDEEDLSSNFDSTKNYVCVLGKVAPLFFALLFNPLNGESENNLKE